MASESLTGIAGQPFSARLFRIAVLKLSLEDVGASASLSSAELDQLRAFVDDDPVAELLDAPFKLKGSTRWTRFSDGKFPVFYSALSPETSMKEKIAWLKTLPSSVIFQRLFECDFSGSAKDLTTLVPSWACLISLAPSDYAICQAIGRQALDDHLDALRTPSARDQPDGVCVPVFRRPPLSNPAVLKHIRFTISEGAVTHDEL
jgi:hypothetical protein